jgi:hypothetical protein
MQALLQLLQMKQYLLQSIKNVLGGIRFDGLQIYVYNYCSRTPSSSLNRYTDQKRYQVCAIFIEWKDVQCPCCSNVLRTKSRRYGHDAL